MVLPIFCKRDIFIPILVVSISAIIVVAIGVGSILSIRNNILEECQTQQIKFNGFVTRLLNSTVMVPKITFNVSTGLPSEFLLQATFQTQYGPISVNDNITLDLPSSVGVPIGPFSATIQYLLSLALGQKSFASLSSTTIISDACTSYIIPTINIVGGLFTGTAAWLTSVSVTLGFWIHHVRKQLREVVQ